MIYNFVFDDSDGASSYLFETETGNVISVSFTDISNLFEAPIIPLYSLDINRKISGLKSNCARHRNDFSENRTRDTILFLIKQFFEEFNGALVALIDTASDRKGLARKFLFSKWYKSFGKEHFTFVEKDVVTQESESYSLLILKKNSGCEQNVIDTFVNFIELINGIN